MVEANETTLQAIDGIIHGTNAIVKVGSLSAFADEIHIRNIGNLNIGTIAAYGAGVFLTANGSIQQNPGGYVQGPFVSLTANGDIGAQLAPVIVNTQNLFASGRNIYIQNVGHLTLVNLTGSTIVLTIGGNLTGGNIHATNLTINVFGSIGQPGAPLKVWVSNKLILISQYGGIYVINLYSEARAYVRQIRSTFLLGMLLSGDANQAMPLMLYILVGVTTRGEPVILNIYIAEMGNTDVLREIADGLKQAGQDSIAMAFIDGMSEAPQAFAEAIAEMFPDMQKPRRQV